MTDENIKYFTTWIIQLYITYYNSMYLNIENIVPVIITDHKLTSC